ncbi:noc3l [Symbiodinium microadriaticum]|nr:noc3l [Symbiodinium microadriaticum]
MGARSMSRSKKRGRSADRVPEAGDEKQVGRKKQKRIEKLQAKKARVANTSAAAAKKAADEAAEAVKGKAKAKDGQLSKAASELIEKLRSGGPAGDRRLLATAAERIAAEPAKELDLFDIFFHLHRVSKDRETRLMALLSGVAVFKDLVPGYRIREPTEQERAQIRSKPVLALERYELKLLQTYRRLLPDLEAAMRNHPVATAPALGAMVKAAFDFNYRQRLIGTAIKHCNSPEKEVRAPLVAGLQEMVESDQRLEGSKEAVLAIGRLAQGMAGRKAKAVPAEDSETSQAHRGLHYELLQILLHLPIGRADAAELAGPAGDMSNADEDVKKGLAEASITLSAEQLRKREGELLYEVFVVYLRILRQRHLHSRELMGTVLTGLARWGQQVNLELLLEILSELRLAVKDAIGRSDELVALHGLNCALVLLSGPSQALLTDVSWLSDSMTGALALALPSMYSVHSEGTTWPPPRCFLEDDEGEVLTSDKELAEAMEGKSVPALVLRCLHAALRCPQGYSTASDAALAALLEQLLSISLTADCHAALAFLREAALLLRRHRRLYSLLDVEGGIFGLGGVADKSVTLAWYFQGISCSLSPVLASAAQALPSSIPKRNEVIADLFPFKDSHQWLAGEVVRHFGAAEDIPKQTSRRSKLASFVSESELRATCE